ncbi:PAS domain-containing protein, partial [Pantoea agglomerans]|nr:PAS domain-containing protein [Pantoea agglomerans]
MRLEVFCQDRLGLTRELLDLLVARNIDLRGIEITALGRIYLNFSALEFDAFSNLMAEIRRTPGVTDVRTVAYMPSEREHRALSALLVAMPDPVFSIDLKSKVELANPAAQNLFNLDEEKMRNFSAGNLINGFNFMRWLESDRVEAQAQHVVIEGRDFLMEARPIYLPGEEGQNDRPVGAMVMLKST